MKKLHAGPKNHIAPNVAWTLPQTTPETTATKKARLESEDRTTIVSESNKVSTSGANRTTPRNSPSDDLRSGALMRSTFTPANLNVCRATMEIAADGIRTNGNATRQYRHSGILGLKRNRLRI